MTPPAGELERELRRLAFVEHRQLLGSLTPAARALLAMRLNPAGDVRVRVVQRRTASGTSALEPAHPSAEA